MESIIAVVQLCLLFLERSSRVNRAALRSCQAQVVENGAWFSFGDLAPANFHLHAEIVFRMPLVTILVEPAALHDEMPFEVASGAEPRSWAEEARIDASSVMEYQQLWVARSIRRASPNSQSALASHEKLDLQARPHSSWRFRSHYPPALANSLWIPFEITLTTLNHGTNCRTLVSTLDRGYEPCVILRYILRARTG